MIYSNLQGILLEDNKFMIFVNQVLYSLYLLDLNKY